MYYQIPVIKECSLDVPGKKNVYFIPGKIEYVLKCIVNKKATKFITTSRTIPDINLRGIFLASYF